MTAEEAKKISDYYSRAMWKILEINKGIEEAAHKGLYCRTFHIPFNDPNHDEIIEHFEDNGFKCRYDECMSGNYVQISWK